MGQPPNLPIYPPPWYTSCKTYFQHNVCHTDNDRTYPVPCVCVCVHIHMYLIIYLFFGLFLHIFHTNIIKRRFKILNKEDPIYLLKSIKNRNEISNMISSRIIDGVALTKFLYWIKVKNKKKISEVDAQNKLEKFRKKNKHNEEHN